jgi:hypothetical protein
MSYEEQLKKIYYSPEEGFLTTQKLYKRLKDDYKQNPIEANEWKKKITLKQIQSFISKQKVGQTFQQPSLRKLGFFPIQTYFGQLSPFTRMMIDIMDVRNEKPSVNKGIKYLFCAIDVYTRFAFVIPLKSKTGTESVQAIKTIFNAIEQKSGGKYKPRVGRYMELISDNESAWKDETQFSKWCKENSIKQTWVRNDYRKKSIVERFIRTLRWLIHKYQSARNTMNYINVLDKLVKNYNTTYHSTLHTSPTAAFEDNSAYEKHLTNRVNKLLARPATKRAYASLQVGDLVRKLAKKLHYKDNKVNDQNQFDKEAQGWSDEVYEIVKVEKLRDYYIQNTKSQHPLQTPFRRNELKKVTTDSMESYQGGDEEEEEKQSVPEIRREEATSNRVNRRVRKELGQNKDKAEEEGVLIGNTDNQRVTRARRDEELDVQRAIELSKRSGKGMKRMRIIRRFKPY